MMMMTGWKTWAGMILVGASAMLEFMGYGEVAKMVMTAGGALGFVGIAHKIEKASK